MRLDPLSPSLRTLVEGPSPATLTLVREDGRPISSPVWFRMLDEAFEVVIGAGDSKLAHLRRDPRCSLLVFEAVRPFRGVQVSGTAEIVPDDGARTRLAIASGYLGLEDGAAFASLSRRSPGYVVRLPAKAARAWDLSDALP